MFGKERVGFEAPYVHRTFENFVTAFRHNGFLLGTLEDVRPDPQDTAPPHTAVPSLLIIELIQS